MEELLANFPMLEAREQEVVLRFVRRILDGQLAYGPLTKGKKNWAKEVLEENLDSCVYTLAALLDLAEDEGGLGKPE